LNAWASAWLTRISALYRLNAARLQVWQQDAAAFAVADGQLRAALAALAAVANDRGGARRAEVAGGRGRAAGAGQFVGQGGRGRSQWRSRPGRGGGPEAASAGGGCAHSRRRMFTCQGCQVRHRWHP
jgi:hypothetical protein